MHKCVPANAGKKPFGGMFMNYSYQRQVVLETLRGQKEHLTAQQLYQLARKSCPRLSPPAFLLSCVPEGAQP